MARRPSSVLTPIQEAYVEAKVTNTPVPDMVTNPTLTARSAKVQEEIARVREEISNLTTLRRVDIIEGILDGITTSKMMSDGGNIIRGWTEIGKILGLYAPEVKKVEITMGQARIKTVYESLTDDQLLKIASGEVIDV